MKTLELTIQLLNLGSGLLMLFFLRKISKGVNQKK